MKATKCVGLKEAVGSNLRKKILLTWLLKLYDDNDGLVELIIIKKRWPMIAELILREFAMWGTAMSELRDFKAKRDRRRRQRAKRFFELSADMRRHKTFSLEDLLVSLQKIREYHGITEGLPTMKQIDEAGKVMDNVPSRVTFSDRLGPKQNWLKFLNMYLAAEDEEEQREALDCIKDELYEAQLLKIDEIAAEEDITLSGRGRTKNEIISDLRQVQVFFNLSRDELPTKIQIDQTSKEIGTAPYTTVSKRLGNRGLWPELLEQWDEKVQIDEFMRQYTDLKVNDILNLDALSMRLQSIATTEELAEAVCLREKIASVHKGKSVDFLIKLDGNVYNVKIER